MTLLKDALDLFGASVARKLAHLSQGPLPLPQTFLFRVNFLALLSHLLLLSTQTGCLRLVPRKD